MTKKMIIDKDFKEELEKSINNLVARRWYFMNMEWPMITNRINHRSVIKDLKNNSIRFIKNYLLEKLGYTAVFYFIVVLYGNKEYPGPYHEIDKALVLLYHIVSGENGVDMDKFLPYSSFYRIYKKFWITNYTNINKKVKYDLEKMFSNTKIRVLSARINNPNYLKNTTLLLDGIDTKIKYYKVNEKKTELYSHKLKSPGIRTQVVIDVNSMILYTSKSQKCAKGNDGSMFLQMGLYKKISKYDNICVDGGYTQYIDKFNEIAEQEGYNEFSRKNFNFPIRKEKNINLTNEEKIINNTIGSYRSLIEHEFSILTSTFKRFTNNRSALQISDIKIFNLQFRVACILKNIKLFMEKFNIKEESHHMLWYADGFEFPSKKNKINVVFQDYQKSNQVYNECIEFQNEFLEKDISDDEQDKEDYNSDSEHEDNIVDEYIIINGKRLKKTKIEIPIDIHE